MKYILTGDVGVWYSLLPSCLKENGKTGKRENGKTGKREAEGEIMSVKKYQVELSQKQRKKLKALSSRGEESARQLTQTRILLLTDNNRPNQ